METPLICIIGYVWPEPASSAAGVRMMQLIESFLSKGFKVAFASAAQNSQYAFNLETIGVNTHVIQLNDDSFNQFIKNLNPNYVLFDRYMIEEQFGWRVSENVPNAIKILDTEDLHFLRQARQLAYQKKISVTQELLQSDLAKREIASILRCDLSLIISMAEYNLLVQDFHISPSLLCYLPIWYRANSATNKGYETRNDFVFIGNYLHEPNRNAVFYLKEKIWPKLREKLSPAKLFIYGAYPDESILNLHHPKSGFFVCGRAEDVNQVMQVNRVCLAPLQFGAGLKGKLLDAMNNGMPSVTTPIGAEGIAEHNHWPGFVCESDEDFIENAISLYNNRNLWEQAFVKGSMIIKEKFSRQLAEPNFYQNLELIHQDLSGHRRMNFIGQVLQHQTLHSARYLSKYIMAKNKNAEFKNQA